MSEDETGTTNDHRWSQLSVNADQEDTSFVGGDGDDGEGAEDARQSRQMKAGQRHSADGGFTPLPLAGFHVRTNIPARMDRSEPLLLLAFTQQPVLMA